MRRGNRHLVGVVMGGRSGGSRDAIMRNLLAENLEKAATKRTVAAITERNSSDANADVAEAEAAARPTQTVQVQGAVQVGSGRAAARTRVDRRRKGVRDRRRHRGRAAAQAKTEPAPLTNGVIQTQPIAAIPGSSEPMKPVKVKTVQVKAGQIKLASAGPAQPAASVTSAIPPARPEVPETSSAVVAKAETNKAETTKARNQPGRNRARPEMPPQPPSHGTGNGVLGVLPASSVPPPPRHSRRWPMPILPRAQPQAVQQNGAIKPAAAHTGWIIQVGALESESEARQRIEARAIRPMVCSPRPIRSPSRWSPRATGSCSGPASPASSAIRPKRYAGR